MLIRVLVEDQKNNEGLESEHGLSLYIETDHHKILFDTGMTDLFAVNAEKLGVDLSLVDILVISHGHYDHGGGLKTFLALNNKAKVYISKHGFGDYYSDKGDRGMTYIGLDQSFKDHEQIQYVDEEIRIDDRITLFSGVQGGRLFPTGNKRLYEGKDGIYINDVFRHEMSMLLEEDSHTFLFSGCSHRGIVNIIEHVRMKDYSWPSHVVGGFHMSGGSSGKHPESDELISEVAGYLKDTECHYYTCHCTGLEAYHKMKERLNGSIEYLSVGESICVEAK